VHLCYICLHICWIAGQSLGNIWRWVRALYAAGEIVPCL
jgi:hypothetical protein